MEGDTVVGIQLRRQPDRRTGRAAQQNGERGIEQELLVHGGLLSGKR
jgi:hypothetical protein